MLNGVPYVRKSKMQCFVTLSVTEAECVAATNCVQDKMYGKRFLESMGLKVRLPMTLYMDNKEELISSIIGASPAIQEQCRYALPTSESSRSKVCYKYQVDQE